jgi:WD40 repeat protein
MLVSMNNLSSAGELLCLYKDLSDKDEKILDILLYSNLKFFVVATTEGNIYVFNYAPNGQVEANRMLIHTFTDHYKSVPSLAKIERYPNLLISASYDQSIRIWSLTTLSLQYTLEIPSNLTYLRITDDAHYILCGKSDGV